MQRVTVAVQKVDCRTKLAVRRYRKGDITLKPVGRPSVLRVATELELVCSSILFGFVHKFIEFIRP